MGNPAVQHMTAGMKLSLGAVIVVGGKARSRTTAISSMHEPMCGNQSLTGMPLWPNFLKPTCVGKSLLRCWPLASLMTTTRASASLSGFCTSLNGVSAMDLPAYLSSIGLGSKLSRWETPPFMKSQITLLAFGRACGCPSGGAHRAGADARAIPSCWRSAPRARPVKPMPRSARKARRWMPPTCTGFIVVYPSARQHILLQLLRKNIEKHFLKCSVLFQQGQKRRAKFKPIRVGIVR